MDELSKKERWPRNDSFRDDVLLPGSALQNGVSNTLRIHRQNFQGRIIMEMAAAKGHT